MENDEEVMVDLRDGVDENEVRIGGLRVWGKEMLGFEKWGIRDCGRCLNGDLRFKIVAIAADMVGVIVE